MDFIAFHMPDRSILSFFAVLVVIAVGPWLAERVRLPGLLGLLFGGLLIGPYVLGIVQESDTFIKSLGTIGLLYLMYLARPRPRPRDPPALQAHRHHLRGHHVRVPDDARIPHRPRARLQDRRGAASGLDLGVAHLAHVSDLPQVRVGEPARGGRHRRCHGDHRHARAHRARRGQRLRDRRRERHRPLLPDHARPADPRGVLLPRPPEDRALAHAQPRAAPTVRYIIALAALFSAVVVCEAFGIDGIVGAFFAGLALNPLIPKAGPLFEHIEFFGSALFIPMFLVSVGLIIEPKVMVDPTTLAPPRCSRSAASAARRSRQRYAGRSSSTRGTRSAPCSRCR